MPWRVCMTVEKCDFEHEEDQEINALHREAKYRSLDKKSFLALQKIVGDLNQSAKSNKGKHFISEIIDYINNAVDSL